MIGSEKEALDVLARRKGVYLGEGSTRKAYRLNDTVYKVCLSPSMDKVNRREIANRQEALAKNIREDVIIPEITSYVVEGRVVNATPYVNGIPTGECVGNLMDIGCDCGDMLCLSPEMVQYLDGIYIDSVSYGNTIVKDGLYYLIDLG